MNITFVVQVAVGSASAAVGGILIFKPQWLGIYPDVDLYAVNDASAVSPSSGVVPGAPSTGNKSSTNDENEKDLKCVIDKEEYDCAVFTIIESNNYINANGTKTKLKNLTSTTSTTKTYCRIIVKEKLVNKLSSASDATLSIYPKKQDDGSADINSSSTLRLKALFSHHNSTINLFDQNNSWYFVGKAVNTEYTETPNNSGTPPKTTQTQKTVTEVTATKDKYQCSFWKGNFKDCEIKYLETGTPTTTSTENLSFVENTTTVSKITANQYYLIKSHEWYSDFYLTSVADAKQTVTNDKIIKFEDVKAVAIINIGSEKKLFHFK